MSIPTWYDLVLLSLAAFRSWKLIAEDAIFDRPRLWFVGRVPKWMVELIECPWCLGLWLGLAWWAGWQLWPKGAIIAASAFAISVLVGVLGEVTD